VVLNLKGVTDVDGAGFNTLVRSSRHLEHLGRSLSLLAVPKALDEELRTSGYIKLFSVFGTEDEALCALRPTPPPPPAA
jgi:anti-anti-sigma regulatory factor